MQGTYRQKTVGWNQRAAAEQRCCCSVTQNHESFCPDLQEDCCCCFKVKYFLELMIILIIGL